MVIPDSLERVLGALSPWGQIHMFTNETCRSLVDSNQHALHGRHRWKDFLTFDLQVRGRVHINSHLKCQGFRDQAQRPGLAGTIVERRVLLVLIFMRADRV